MPPKVQAPANGQGIGSKDVELETACGRLSREQLRTFIIQQAGRNVILRRAVLEFAWSKQRHDIVASLLGKLDSSKDYEIKRMQISSHQVTQVLEMVLKHYVYLLDKRDAELLTPAEPAAEVDHFRSAVHLPAEDFFVSMANIDKWLIRQVSLEGRRVLGKKLDRLINRGRSLCRSQDQVRDIAKQYRGSYRSGADFDSIFCDVMVDFYPPVGMLQVSNPSYRPPFISPPSFKSTALLLSLPSEILRQIFQHGASSLIPKPGASLRDMLTSNGYRKMYLCNASLVTTTWRIQAQLEYLSYVVCCSIKALDHLVTMLEGTGRIMSLNRLVCSLVELPDDTVAQGLFGYRVFTTPNHPINRLLELGPMLDELEIFRGSAVLTDSLSCSLRKSKHPSCLRRSCCLPFCCPIVSGSALKISSRTTLYPINAETKGTLVLNNVTTSLEHGEDESGITSKLESLVVMNSDCPAPRITPTLSMLPQITPVLSFQILKTLSMDGHPLSIKLLRTSTFPAVTTFELIPYQLHRHGIANGFKELTLLVLKQIPTLQVIILPLVLFCKAEEALGQEIEGIRVELAVRHKLNWLNF